MTNIVQEGLSLASLKNELYGLLHEAGIPEFSVTLKDFTKNPHNYLGAYAANSQFRSRPIIRLDIALHEATLKEQGSYSESGLKEAVLTTLCHEYGHVMEEFIRKNLTRNIDPVISQLLHHSFADMEDFAETFAKHISTREYISIEKMEAVQDITKHYVQKVFPEESIAWVGQPKWKRVLDYYLDHNEKSYASLACQEGAFNRCRQASEALAARLVNISDIEVQVLRLQGYKGSLAQAHPKWQKMKNECITHYVVLMDKQWAVDLTAKQFNPQLPARHICPVQALSQEWLEVEVFQDYTLKKNTGMNLKYR